VWPEGVVLEDHPDIALVGWKKRNRLAFEIDLPVIRLMKTSDEPEDRCLSATRRAKECKKLSVLNVQRNVTHSFERPKSLDDIFKFDVHKSPLGSKSKEQSARHIAFPLSLISSRGAEGNSPEEFQT
jgi:hypothetical protein